MQVTLVVHIVAGSLGLLSGFAALYATKGAPLHRRLGIVFVCSMLTMSLAGLTITIVRGVAPAINVPAALVTGALVITALTTVREPSAKTRALDFGAMLVLLAVGVTGLVLGFATVTGGMPSGFAFPLFLFGTVGLVAGIGDVRVMRSGPLRGAPRIARHLWRMSFALFIAALSFFIGQAKVIPEPIRIMPLLALPVLTVLLTMFYWLYRVRFKRSLRGLVRLTETSAPGQP